MNRLFGLIDEATTGFYSGNYAIKCQLSDWAMNLTDKELEEFIDITIAVKTLINRGKRD